MNKRIIKRVILLSLVFVISICTMQFPSLAAGSFSVSAGKTGLTTGESTTMTIKIVDCAGKFKVNSTDSNVVSVGSSVIDADDSNNPTFTR